MDGGGGCEVGRDPESLKTSASSSEKYGVGLAFRHECQTSKHPVDYF